MGISVFENVCERERKGNGVGKLKTYLSKSFRFHLNLRYEQTMSDK